MQTVTEEKAVANIRSGQRIFIQGMAMTPHVLINALCQRSHELENVELVHLHTEGEAPYTKEPHRCAFVVNSLFVGTNVREDVNSSDGNYTPIFLGEAHLLFTQNILPLDAAFIQVSKPDKHGFCSLGTSVDVTLAALRSAKSVIAQINPDVPRTHGDGIIHMSHINLAVETSGPINAKPFRAPTPAELQIGEYVAGLVEDEATLQMGIGAIPNAVLSMLGNHRNLGIHTEMFSDGIIPLVKTGVINGSHKQIDRDKIVGCFALGSQSLYDFIADNPQVLMKEASYTNDTAVIRSNKKVTAINSAIEIDLTGQVCAETIGRWQYSGVGGQMDFIRGASMSEGGKAIIALPSITKKGLSKIVSDLKPGAGVTTTRAHVRYVVTEYGVVNLFGRNLRERAQLLTSIAHPEHREVLEKAVKERFK
ncbi:MAG: acetyl-CoA hydrolase/transferase C-terminal domain-containing protein [Salibacteraceae bacterium]